MNMDTILVSITIARSSHRHCPTAMLVLWICTSLVVLVNGQCDYVQYMYPGGQSYTIQSEGVYYQGSSCTWRAYTDLGAYIQLSCNINIPMDGAGCIDEFYVSNTQDPNDGIIYCGYQSISHHSTSNQLLVQINVHPNSPGGSFSCDIRAVTGGTSSSCLCGYSYTNRIVGGTETGVNEFPMMAALINNVGIACGSTIISQRHALTAAHCVKDQNPSNLALLVGDHDFSTGNETDAQGVILISELYYYPLYDESRMINDIGMVKTVNAINLSPKVGPACLPFNHPETLVGEMVQITGWGTTEFGGPKAKKLQKATLQVLPITICQEVYGSKINPYGQMCLFKNHTDACQYDSGGPVLWLDTNTNRLFIVGIISYGRGCALGYPSVNTRTYAYLDWIEENLNGEAVCVI